MAVQKQDVLISVGLDATGVLAGVQQLDSALASTVGSLQSSPGAIAGFPSTNLVSSLPSLTGFQPSSSLAADAAIFGKLAGAVQGLQTAARSLTPASSDSLRRRYLETDRRFVDASPEAQQRAIAAFNTGVEQSGKIFTRALGTATSEIDLLTTRLRAFTSIATQTGAAGGTPVIPAIGVGAYVTPRPSTATYFDDERIARGRRAIAEATERAATAARQQAIVAEANLSRMAREGAVTPVGPVQVAAARSPFVPVTAGELTRAVAPQPPPPRSAVVSAPTVSSFAPYQPPVANVGGPGNMLRPTFFYQMNEAPPGATPLPREPIPREVRNVQIEAVREAALEFTKAFAKLPAEIQERVSEFSPAKTLAKVLPLTSEGGFFPFEKFIGDSGQTAYADPRLTTMTSLDPRERRERDRIARYLTQRRLALAGRVAELDVGDSAAAIDVPVTLSQLEAERSRLLEGQMPGDRTRLVESRDRLREIERELARLRASETRGRAALVSDPRAPWEDAKELPSRKASFRLFGRGRVQLPGEALEEFLGTLRPQLEQSYGRGTSSALASLATVKESKFSVFDAIARSTPAAVPLPEGVSGPVLPAIDLPIIGDLAKKLGIDVSKFTQSGTPPGALRQVIDSTFRQLTAQGGRNALQGIGFRSSRGFDEFFEEFRSNLRLQKTILSGVPDTAGFDRYLESIFFKLGSGLGRRAFDDSAALPAPAPLSYLDAAKRAQNDEARRVSRLAPPIKELGGEGTFEELLDRELYTSQERAVLGPGGRGTSREAAILLSQQRRTAIDSPIYTKILELAAVSGGVGNIVPFFGGLQSGGKLPKGLLDEIRPAVMAQIELLSPMLQRLLSPVGIWQDGGRRGSDTQGLSKSEILLGQRNRVIELGGLAGADEPVNTQNILYSNKLRSVDELLERIFRVFVAAEFATPGTAAQRTSLYKEVTEAGIAGKLTDENLRSLGLTRQEAIGKFDVYGRGGILDLLQLNSAAGVGRVLGGGETEEGSRVRLAKDIEKMSSVLSRNQDTIAGILRSYGYTSKDIDRALGVPSRAPAAVELKQLPGRVPGLGGAFDVERLSSGLLLATAPKRPEPTWRGPTDLQLGQLPWFAAGQAALRQILFTDGEVPGLPAQTGASLVRRPLRSPLPPVDQVLYPIIPESGRLAGNTRLLELESREAKRQRELAEATAERERELSREREQLALRREAGSRVGFDSVLGRASGFPGTSIFFAPPGETGLGPLGRAVVGDAAAFLRGGNLPPEGAARTPLAGAGGGGAGTPPPPVTPLLGAAGDDDDFARRAMRRLVELGGGTPGPGAPDDGLTSEERAWRARRQREAINARVQAMGEDVLVGKETITVGDKTYGPREVAGNLGAERLDKILLDTAAKFEAFEGMSDRLRKALVDMEAAFRRASAKFDADVSKEDAGQTTATKARTRAEDQYNANKILFEDQKFSENSVRNRLLKDLIRKNIATRDLEIEGIPGGEFRKLTADDLFDPNLTGSQVRQVTERGRDGSVEGSRLLGDRARFLTDFGAEARYGDELARLEERNRVRGLKADDPRWAAAEAESVAVDSRLKAQRLAAGLGQAIPDIDPTLSPGQQQMQANAHIAALRRVQAQQEAQITEQVMGQYGYGQPTSKGARLIARLRGGGRGGGFGGGGGFGPDGFGGEDPRAFFGQGLLSTIKYGLPSMLLYGGIFGLGNQLKEVEQFRVAMTNVKSLIESTFGSESDAVFANFSNNLLQVARDTGTPSAALAEMSRLIVGSFGNVQQNDLKSPSDFGGLFGEDLVNAQVSSAAQLSKVFGITPQEINNQLTAASFAFSKNFEQIGDVAVKLENLTGVPGKELVDFLGDVGPVAKEAGFTLEEFSAIAGLALQKAGISGSALAEKFGRIIPAITSEKSTFYQLAARSPVLQNATTDSGQSFVEAVGAGDTVGIFQLLAENFDQLDKSAQDFIVQLVGGRREAQALLGVFGDASRLKEIREELYGAAGSLDERFSKIAQNISVVWARAKEAFVQLLQAIVASGLGEAVKALGDAFSFLGGVLGGLLSGFTGIDSALGGLLSKLAGYGLLLAGLGKGLSGFAAFQSWSGLATAFPGAAGLITNPGGSRLFSRTARAGARESALFAAVAGGARPGGIDPVTWEVLNGGPGPASGGRSGGGAGGVLPVGGFARGVTRNGITIKGDQLVRRQGLGVVETVALEGLSKEAREEAVTQALAAQGRLSVGQRVGARIGAAGSSALAFLKTPLGAAAGVATAIAIGNWVYDGVQEANKASQALKDRRIADLADWSPEDWADPRKVRREANRANDQQGWWDKYVWSPLFNVARPGTLFEQAAAGKTSEFEAMRPFFEEVAGASAQTKGDLSSPVARQVYEEFGVGRIGRLYETETGKSFTEDNWTWKPTARQNARNDAAKEIDRVQRDASDKKKALTDAITGGSDEEKAYFKYALDLREKLGLKDTESLDKSVVESLVTEDPIVELLKIIDGDKEGNVKQAKELLELLLESNGSVEELRKKYLSSIEGSGFGFAFDPAGAQTSKDWEAIKTGVTAGTVTYSEAIAAGEAIIKTMKEGIAASRKAGVGVGKEQSELNKIIKEVQKTRIAQAEAVAQSLLNSQALFGKLGAEGESDRLALAVQAARRMLDDKNITDPVLKSKAAGDLAKAQSDYFDSLIDRAKNLDDLARIQEQRRVARTDVRTRAAIGAGGLAQNAGAQSAISGLSELGFMDTGDAEAFFARLIEAQAIGGDVEAGALGDLTSLIERVKAQRDALKSKDGIFNKGKYDELNQLFILLTGLQAYYQSGNGVFGQGAAVDFGDLKDGEFYIAPDGRIIVPDDFDPNGDPNRRVSVTDAMGNVKTMSIGEIIASQLGIISISGMEGEVAKNRAYEQAKAAEKFNDAADRVSTARAGNNRGLVNQIRKRAADRKKLIAEASGQQDLIDDALAAQLEADNEAAQILSAQKDSLSNLRANRLSIAGNDVAAATERRNRASQKVQEVRQQGGDPGLLADAQAEVDSANEAIRQARIAEVESNEQYLRALVERDPAKAASVDIAIAQRQMADARGVIQKNQARVALLQAQRNAEKAMQEVRDSRSELRETELGLMDTSQGNIGAAAERLRRAQDRYNDAVRGGAGETELNGLRSEILRSQKDVTDVTFNEQKDYQQWLFDMGKITKSQLITYLKGALATLDPNSKKAQNLALEIKRLQDDSAESQSGMLPATLKLPTFYEARRLNQSVNPVTGQAGGYQDNRVISIQINMTPASGVTAQEVANTLSNTGLLGSAGRSPGTPIRVW